MHRGPNPFESWDKPLNSSPGLQVQELLPIVRGFLHVPDIGLAAFPQLAVSEARNLRVKLERSTPGLP